MTDREDFEDACNGIYPSGWMKFIDTRYVMAVVQSSWELWQAYAAIKQKEIEELEARIKASQEQEPYAWFVLDEIGKICLCDPRVVEAFPLYAIPVIHAKECEHEWVSSLNPDVVKGSWCNKCGIVKPVIPEGRQMSDKRCDYCGATWELHEFGVPQPYCPKSYEKLQLQLSEANATIAKMREALLDISKGELQVPDFEKYAVAIAKQALPTEGEKE